MLLSVGCTLGYEVQAPGANFTVNILANRDPFQHGLDEGIRLTPDLPLGERPAPAEGNRVDRVEVPAGPLAVDERAAVDEAAGGVMAGVGRLSAPRLRKSRRRSWPA